MYLPDGFGTVAPYIFVNGAGEFGEFLNKAFGGFHNVWSINHMISHEIT